MGNIYWINTSKFDKKIDKSTWLETSESLINNKFVVTLLTGYKDNKWHPNRYRLKIQYFNAIDIAGLFKLTLNVSIFIWLLRNAIRDDIIIVSVDVLWISFLIKKIKKCKIHLDIRTVPVEIGNFKARFRQLITWTIPLKLFKNSPDSYSFITRLLKQKIEGTLNVTFQDYVIWSSGVNVEHFSIVRKNSIHNQNKFVITYVGVVTKSRGLDRVVQAIYRLKERYRKIFFQVIGDGPFLPYLKKTCAELELNNRVVFKGYIPYELIPVNLIDTDCFICPLPDKAEWNVSSPLKVFEYLACAKPIILTPIISHKNIIDNSEFVVWTDGDRICDFVKAIEYAYKNRYELFHLSGKSLDYVNEKYGWKEKGEILGNYLRIKTCNASKKHIIM